MPKPHHPSAAVLRNLRKLGQDIREARLRRNLPMEIVGDRAFASRHSVIRVEAGDPDVKIGIYASVLNALGLLDGLASIASPAHDQVGSALASEALPKRARLKRAISAKNDHA
jgi:hypothetical protein